MTTNSPVPDAPGRPRLYCGGQEPVFLAALCFSSGIAIAQYMWRAPHSWLIAFLVSALAACFFFRRRPQVACAFLIAAFLPLGCFYLQAYDAGQTAAPDLQAFATGQDEVTVIGHVVREGVLRDGQYGGKQESVDIQAERLETDAHELNQPIGLRMTIFSKQSEEERAEAAGSSSSLLIYRYGQRLRFPAKLRRPRNYANPGAVDTRGYLASQGISLTGSAPAASVEVLPGFAGSRLGRWRASSRRSVLTHIQQLWPGEQGALMQAMLIGGRAFFARELKTDFQRTGTYHILVVSGINVGILAFAVFWVLRRLSLGETWATVVTIVLSCGYAFLADLGPPIVRATITLNIYLLTRLLFRDRAGLNALGIAGFGILLVNPRALFEASFQLTFVSVIAVAGIAVPVLRRTIFPLLAALRNIDSPAFDYALPTAAAQFRSDLRLLRQQMAGICGKAPASFVVVRGARLLLACAELLMISALIELSLSLPMAWYFHRTTTMSLPSNSLVIPIASVLMPAAVLAVTLSYVSAWLAYVPALITAYALSLLTGTIRLIGHFRVSDIRVPAPPVTVCLIAGACFAAALVLARQRRWLAWAGIISLAISAVLIVAAPRHQEWKPGILEVTAIDVGQGDSLLIVTPEGKTLLVDAGGIPGNSHSDFDAGEEIVSPYLWSRGIRRLDAVAISHAHSDHLGGMSTVIANFRPSELWYGVESPVPEFLQVKEAAAKYSTQLRKRTAGEGIDFGGVHVRVLNPAPYWEPRDPAQDDDSLVLHLQNGRTSALLVGDAHRRIEKMLERQAPQADLLKVGHHGSATSSSAEFLASVKPQFAVVSVGFYNSFGHPRQDVMRRYAEAGIRTYRTDLAGAVSFYLDGNTVTAKPALR